MQDGNIILNPLLSVKFRNAAHIYPDKCQILVHLSFFVFFFNWSAWRVFKCSNSEPWRWALFHPTGNNILTQESHIALLVFCLFLFCPGSIGMAPETPRKKQPVLEGHCYWLPSSDCWRCLSAGAASSLQLLSCTGRGLQGPACTSQAAVVTLLLWNWECLYFSAALVWFLSFVLERC